MGRELNGYVPTLTDDDGVVRCAEFCLRRRNCWVRRIAVALHGSFLWLLPLQPGLERLRRRPKGTSISGPAESLPDSTDRKPVPP